MVVELADFDGCLSAEVIFELALFRDFVAEVGEGERLDVVGKGVEGGGVWSMGRGAEDVAVGFQRCVGLRLACCFACCFVGAPVGFWAAVFCGFAAAAFAGAGVGAWWVGAGVGHDGVEI